MKKLFLLLALCASPLVFGQYWQQSVSYSMDIDLDVEAHQYDGTSSVVYTNNSPDTLHKVYFHLYFNAFQPGSMMDVRSLNITDPDRRVKDRISKLEKDEIGYHNIISLRQHHMGLNSSVSGTVLKA